MIRSVLLTVIINSLLELDLLFQSVEKMDCCKSNQVQNGWFREINDMWPGQHFALKVDKVLSCEKSEFQEVMVLQT